MQMQSMRLRMEAETGKSDVLCQPEVSEQAVESAQIQMADYPKEAEVCAGCGTEISEGLQFTRGRSPFCGEGCEVNFWNDLT